MGQIHNPTCRPFQPSIHLSAFRFLPFVWDECVRLGSESDAEILGPQPHEWGCSKEVFTGPEVVFLTSPVDRGCSFFYNSS